MQVRSVWPWLPPDDRTGAAASQQDGALGKPAGAAAGLRTEQEPSSHDSVRAAGHGDCGAIWKERSVATSLSLGHSGLTERSQGKSLCCG